METLVAISVMAISLVVILQLFSGGLKSSRLSGEYTRSIFHAREKMEEILLADKLTDGILEGEFEDGFRWKTEILLPEPEEEEEGDAELPFKTFAISVDVMWDVGGREKHFKISTMKIAQRLEA